MASTLCFTFLCRSSSKGPLTCLRVGGLQSGGAYFLMAFSMLLLKEGFSAAANGARVSATQTVTSSLHLEVADFAPAKTPV